MRVGRAPSRARRVPHHCPRRAARMPPARSTRTTTPARPSLRRRDVIALGADLDLGHGADVPDLEVDTTVELLAFLAGIVAEGGFPADRDHLDRGLGHAELDQELLHRLGPALGERTVVLGGT